MKLVISTHHLFFLPNLVKTFFVIKNHAKGFARERGIPDMFHSIVSDMHRKFPDSLSIFKYYLDRHIEVDGDHHSNLAIEMTCNLCGNNEIFWQEAEEASIKSLQQRIALWDGIYNEIMLKREKIAVAL